VIRPKTSPRAGADRWLVSYADFTTLLLVFFMTLYAVSDVNPDKLAAAAASMQAAFEAPVETATTAGTAARVDSSDRPAETRAVPPPDATLLAARTRAIAAVRERIEQELAGAILAGQLEIGSDERGLVLSLPESATFPVATADVTATAQPVIDRVAATLGPLAVNVRIEGHTDNAPIRTARYSSNWELSTARASAVVARFIDQHIDPQRLSAAGYAEFHPRTSNDSVAGRASNRRVDVIVIAQATELPETARPEGAGD
jgi:chemotaxis protein MotB